MLGVVMPDSRLLDETILRVQETGWAILPGAFRPAELRLAVEEAKTLVPTVKQYEALTSELDPLTAIGDPTLDYHATHLGDRRAAWQNHRLSGATPALLGLGLRGWFVELAATLLGDAPVLDAMSLMAKYARGGEAFDQGFHIDPLYATYPRASTPSLRFWVYLTDVTCDHGPTEFVTLDDRNDLSLFENPTPDFSGWYYEHDHRDALRGRVEKALGEAGSILIYQARTHHRATPFLAESGCRWIASFSFRAASWRWLATSWDHPRTGAPIRPDFVAMVPGEREMFGFPPVGDKYWTDNGALDEVERLFPGIDLDPYRRASQ